MNRFTGIKAQTGQSQQNDWSHSLSPWETTTPPVDMPLWQFTATALNQGDSSMSYYPNGSPITPYAHHRSSTPSTLTSLNVAEFPRNARFAPLTPVYDDIAKTSNARLSIPQRISQSYGESLENEDLIEDEDSDRYLWEPKSSSAGPPSSFSRPTHRRTHSANEISSKTQNEHIQLWNGTTENG